MRVRDSAKYDENGRHSRLKRLASDARDAPPRAIEVVMRFMRIVNAIAGLIMAAAAISVNAACRIDVEICAAGSPWFSASFFTVQIEFPGTEERGSLAF